ncbi:MAG: DUF1801 domain-containing protein [Saprospiraceae bacterium]|nr:DUF1801 domain-containing protein [Saprospiraceae bacterium]
MTSTIDNFYITQEEPNKSCLMALRQIILNMDDKVTPEWKYNMPMFYYKKKMFCYVWVDKKTNYPYLGLVEGKEVDHPHLVQGKRSRMKIFNINPHEDLPITDIKKVLTTLIKFYDSKY